jgi:hypothetical protein
MSESKTKSVPRREFLKAAGLTSGAVGAAAVALSATPARAAKDQATGTKDAGYRETEHVLKYYETARF